MLALTQEREFTEYLSALVTVELCAEIHGGTGRDEAIRNCCKRIAPRLASIPRIYGIFSGLARDRMAGVTLYILRRGLEEIAGGAVELEQE